MRTSPQATAVASLIAVVAFLTLGVTLSHATTARTATTTREARVSKRPRVNAASVVPALRVPKLSTAETTAPKPAAKPSGKSARTIAARKAVERPTGKSARTLAARKGAVKSAKRRVSGATKLARDKAYANELLAKYVAEYPILKGARVRFGRVTNNNQGECYYRTGVIVINPRQHRGIDVILGHEIWHVIDWRDNHRIDWGERLPPRYPKPY